MDCWPKATRVNNKKKKNIQGTFTGSKDNKIFFLCIRLKADAVYQKSSIADWIAGSFPYSGFQQAKVLQTVTATAPNKSEPQPSPA